MVLDTVKLKNRKEYHTAWNAWKRCCKRVDSQGEHFECIHDRFLRDQVYRESQLKIGWTEQKCIVMDELTKQNHTYHLSTEEFKRYHGQWYLTLNKSGKNAPMPLRPDFRAAVSLKNRLHREFGEQVAEPISPAPYRRWHSSVGHVRLELVELIIFVTIFCYYWFRLQSIAIHKNGRRVKTDTPHTSFFSFALHAFNDVQSHIMAQECVRAARTHVILMPSMMSG